MVQNGRMTRKKVRSRNVHSNSDDTCSFSHTRPDLSLSGVQPVLQFKQPCSIASQARWLYDSTFDFWCVLRCTVAISSLFSFLVQLLRRDRMHYRTPLNKGRTFHLCSVINPNLGGVYSTSSSPVDHCRQIRPPFQRLAAKTFSLTMAAIIPIFSSLAIFSAALTTFAIGSSPLFVFVTMGGMFARPLCCS